MIFSYYFDSAKTHRLVMEARPTSFSERDGGWTRVSMTAIIEEIKDGRSIVRQSAVRQFNFPPQERGQTEPDFDVSRRFFKDENKWVLKLSNRRNDEESEDVQVSLISIMNEREPLGMDLYHDRESYEFELRANTLNQLSQNVVPPTVTQAVANHPFTSAGHPTGFYSNSSVHNSTYRAYDLSDFRYQLPGLLPDAAEREIRFNLAPQLNGVKDDEYLYSVSVTENTRISIYNNRVIVKDTKNDKTLKESMFDSLVSSKVFYDNGFLSRALFSVKVVDDVIIVKYNDKEILATTAEKESVEEILFYGAPIDEDTRKRFYMNQLRVNITQ